MGMDEETGWEKSTVDEQESEAADQSDMLERLYTFFGGESDRLVGFLLRRDRALGLAEAQDLVSDLLLRLLGRLIPLRTVRNLSAYIFRSLSNLHVDLKRQQRREQSLDSAVTDEEGGSLLDLLASPDTPQETFDQRLLHKRLFEAIDALPPDQRAVFVATELLEKTFETLSSEWNTPIGTLLARKHRAVKRLRAELADLDPNQYPKIEEN